MSRCVTRFWPFVLCLLAFGARADIVTDWADTTMAIADDGPNTIRTMALAQNAVYEAVNAITARYPRDRVDLGPTQGASVEAAVAAASRAVLLQEAPGLKEKIEAAYARALARIAAGEASTNGIGVGERAAADVLTKHLAFFFIPIAVGLMDWGGLLCQVGHWLLLALVVSSAAGMVTSGGLIQLFSARAREKAQ